MDYAAISRQVKFKGDVRLMSLLLIMQLLFHIDEL